MIKHKRIRVLAKALRTIAEASPANKTVLKSIEIGLFKTLLNNNVVPVFYSRILDDTAALIDDINLMLDKRPIEQTLLDDAISFILDQHLVNTAAINEQLAFNFSRGIADAGGVSDSAYREIVKVLTDAASVSDGFNLDKGYGLNQTANVSELITTLLDKKLYNTANIFDTTQAIIHKSFNESVSIIDFISHLRNPNPLDTSGATDTFESTLDKVVTEIASVVDDIHGQWTKQLTDTSTSGDMYSYAFEKQKQDLAGVTDIFSYIISGAATWFDTSMVNELLSVIFAKIFVDNISIMDSVTHSFNKNPTDSAILSDILQYQMFLNRSFAETVSIGDICSRNFTKSFSDTVVTSDGLVSNIVQGEQVFNEIFGGNSGVTEQISVSSDKTFIDTSSITDNINVVIAAPPPAGTVFSGIGSVYSQTDNLLTKTGAAGWPNSNAYVATAINSGSKVYVEVYASAGTVFLLNVSPSAPTYQTDAVTKLADSWGFLYFNAVTLFKLYGEAATRDVVGGLITISVTDVIGVTFDYDAMTLTLYVNNSLIGSVDLTAYGETPYTTDVYFSVSLYPVGGTIEVVSQSSQQVYSPPTGFTALGG